jgi:hypothetical protein
MVTNIATVAGGGESNLSDDTASDTTTITGPMVTVTVSAPFGLSFSVDGTMYTSPLTQSWAIGSLHTIATTSPQTGFGFGGSYSFTAWSDGGAISHMVTATAGTTTYTAMFTTGSSSGGQ